MDRPSSYSCHCRIDRLDALLPGRAPTGGPAVREQIGIAGFVGPRRVERRDMDSPCFSGTEWPFPVDSCDALVAAVNDVIHGFGALAYGLSESGLLHRFIHVVGLKVFKDFRGAQPFASKSLGGGERIMRYLASEERPALSAYSQWDGFARADGLQCVGVDHLASEGQRSLPPAYRIPGQAPWKRGAVSIPA